MLKKKNLKRKMLLLSCVCALAVASGVGMLQEAEVASAASAVTTLQMIPGASIRVGTSEEITGTLENTNGIRFAAEVSVAEYEALDDKGGVVTAGTFILPYEYITYAEVNAENCFTGATQAYTWEGKQETVSTEDEKATILHVAGRATKVESEINKGSEVYRINGSVVDMKLENLDRNYIGVTYIKVLEKDGSVNYYFAQAKEENSRSIISVAQKIFFSEEATSSEESVATDYAETYLDYKGGSVSHDVKYTVYEMGSTGFDKVEEGEKSFVIDSVEDFTASNRVTANDPNRLLMPKLSDEESIVLNFGMEQSVSYYYEKTIGNAVVFDSANATSASNLFSNLGIQTDCALISANGSWGYRGESSLLIDTYSQRSARMTFANPIMLPAETDTFTMMIRNPNNESYLSKSEYPIGVVINDGRDWGPYGAFKLDASKGVNGEYQVSIKLSEKISQVNYIQFLCNGQLTSYTLTAVYGEYAGTYTSEHNAAGNGQIANYRPFFVDFIQAEYDLMDTAGVLEVSKAEAEAGTKELALSFASTVFSSKEINEGTSWTWKKLPGGAVQSLTLTDGKVSLPVEKETTYQINATVAIGGDVIANSTMYLYGYYPYMVDTYEGEITHNNNAYTSGEVQKGTSVDGSGSLVITSCHVNHTFTQSYTESPIGEGVEHSMICMWIYNPHSTEVTLKGSRAGNWMQIKDFDAQWGTLPTADVTLTPGWAYYEFTLERTVDSVQTISIIGKPLADACNSSNNMKIRFDRIALK